MPFSDEDLAHFHSQGFVLRPAVLTSRELSAIEEEIVALSVNDTPSRVMEQDGQTIRALHGCHLDSVLFERLVRHPAFLDPVRQILGSEVYLYQFKVNVKAAFRGDLWPWHQDYVFWRDEDGMPAPRAVSVITFLDEVTEFNGPIYFMPGSQREGCINVTTYHSGGERDWSHNVSADLKYRLNNERVMSCAQSYGLVAPKGPAGTMLFFHCNIIHGSPSNISPYPRRMIILSYNAVDNIQPSNKPTRPEFLVGRDFSPLEPLKDNTL